MNKLIESLHKEPIDLALNVYLILAFFAFIIVIARFRR